MAEPVHMVPALAVAVEAGEGGPAIRSVILSAFGEVALSMGLDPVALLRRCAIDPICLVDPNIPIPVKRAISLIEIAAIEANRSDFGIQLALARGAPDIGPLALLIREEPDLRSALRSLQTYFPVHSRSMSMTLSEQGDIALFTSQLAVMRAPFAAIQTTEMVVCGLIQFVKWLVGPGWAPLTVCFAHAAPPNVRTYRSLLGCDVRFGQDFDGLVLTTKDLDLPLQTASPLARRYAEQYVQSLAGSAPEELIGTVRALITALLPLGRCSVGVVARHIGVERSTLSRRLAARGTSYSRLLNETRMAIATRSCQPGRPLSELADLLGFSSLSTFSRWFTANFGSQAREWRQSPQAGGLA